MPSRDRTIAEPGLLCSPGGSAEREVWSGPQSVPLPPLGTLLNTCGPCVSCSRVCFFLDGYLRTIASFRVILMIFIQIWILMALDKNMRSPGDMLALVPFPVALSYMPPCHKGNPFLSLDSLAHSGPHFWSWPLFGLKRSSFKGINCLEDKNLNALRITELTAPQSWFAILLSVS